jgi:predicted Zn-dependent protease
MDHVLNDSSTEFQKEADQLGVQYAWKAGYDPRGFVAFLESQTAETRNALVGAKTPLPDRLLNLFSEIEYLPALEHPIVDSPEFQRYRMR